MSGAVRATVVLPLLCALTACTTAEGEPTPNAAPAVTVAGPAASGTTVGTPTGAAGFTAFATPCPRVGDRAGAPVDPPRDTSSSTTADCVYGDRATSPHLTSVSVLTEPGRPTGTTEQVSAEMYRALVAKAKTDAVHGVTARKVPGLGDEATLVINLKDNVALLVVRSANALIQASSTVDARGDRERELIELQSQEPVVTALARALLAELR